jgi:hypothetical protein
MVLSARIRHQWTLHRTDQRESGFLFEVEIPKQQGPSKKEVKPILVPAG